MSKEQTKKCTKCGQIKALSEFHRNKRRVDGLRSCCKSCVSNYDSIYSKKNRTKKTQRNRRYYKNNKRRILKTVRKYQEREADKIRLRKRKHYELNKDRIRAKQREYSEQNYDKVKEHKNAYRARLAGVENGVKPTLSELIKLVGGICPDCGKKPQKWTEDHITPISLGGPNTWWNVRALCLSCNSRKGSLHPDEYAKRYLGRDKL